MFFLGTRERAQRGKKENSQIICFLELVVRWSSCCCTLRGFFGVDLQVIRMAKAQRGEVVSLELPAPASWKKLVFFIFTLKSSAYPKF